MAWGKRPPIKNTGFPFEIQRTFGEYTITTPHPPLRGWMTHLQLYYRFFREFFSVEFGRVRQIKRMPSSGILYHSR
jgi:hypothetical protein